MPPKPTVIPAPKCKACGRKIKRTRNRGGTLESNARYKKRLYCSHECRKKPQIYVCPDCGGKKSEHAKRCTSCHLARVKASPAPLCAGCGAQKGSNRGTLCRSCVMDKMNADRGVIVDRRKTIPVARVRPIVEAWIATKEFPKIAFEALALNGSAAVSTWATRLGDGKKSKLNSGWWSQEYLSVRQVDEFLAAAGLTDLWHLDLADLYELEEAA